MKKYILLLVFLTTYFWAYSTHERAGEITYKAISELTYVFTIVTYTYTPSLADRPELELNWGDGTSSIVPRTDYVFYPNNIKRNVYGGAEHTFPGPGTYIISLEDPNRNYGVLNIPNSVNVPFYIQTELVINPFLGPNNSVELLVPPVDNGCVNNLFIHNPGAFDVDGDSISYKLVDCRGAFGLPIPGYILPNMVDPSVPATFTIDQINGTVLWDKPVLQGEYNFAFLIEEWRFGIRISYVTRDMQITIIACDHYPPVIGHLTDTCIEAGTTLSFDVSATDPDNDELTLRAIGGPFILENSPAIFPPAFGQGYVTSTFTWPTIYDHIQLQPYQVVFLAKDTFRIPQLADIKTVNIKVVSPAPKNLSATPVGNSIHLSWNKVKCNKAIGYEIYRRNGFYGFIPGHCETGVPEYTGYLMIETNEGINDTTFIDNNNGNGLVHGNDYCYMIVGIFPDGDKSYASEEICATLKKDLPIITNISVEETDINNGKVYIAWSKPTEIDTILFPGPFKYLINRSDNASGSGFVVIDSLNSLNDTTYFDYYLNTKNKFYYYKTDLYNVEPQNRYYIGSTQKASSMFLNIDPTDNTLILTCNINVPWNNYRYDVFRYNPETTVFDSIGFCNEPSFNDTNLVNGKEYTYFIRSAGNYTAPGLVNPIINLSQINSGIPVDNVPPCPPVLSVKTDCEKIENILTWINPGFPCPEDIAKYFIYFSPYEFEDLILFDSVTDAQVTTYIHSNLTTIAGCYSVTAIDSVGNQSEYSNVVCVSIDSCSTYSLPNVFTPNNDEWNEKFVPFPYTSVEKVDMKIFNRWGKLVFKTNDPDINWDGKNKFSNNDCPDGVYFYVCDVYEITLIGPTKRTLKGSVTIFR